MIPVTDGGGSDDRTNKGGDGGTGDGASFVLLGGDGVAVPGKGRAAPPLGPPRLRLVTGLRSIIAEFVDNDDGNDGNSVDALRAGDGAASTLTISSSSILVGALPARGDNRTGGGVGIRTSSALLGFVGFSDDAPFFAITRVMVRRGGVAGGGPIDTRRVVVAAAAAVGLVVATTAAAVVVAGGALVVAAAAGR